MQGADYLFGFWITGLLSKAKKNRHANAARAAQEVTMTAHVRDLMISVTKKKHAHRLLGHEKKKKEKRKNAGQKKKIPPSSSWQVTFRESVARLTRCCFITATSVALALARTRRPTFAFQKKATGK